jgi:hypothetical protein
VRLDLGPQNPSRNPLLGPDSLAIVTQLPKKPILLPFNQNFKLIEQEIKLEEGENCV